MAPRPPGEQPMIKGSCPVCKREIRGQSRDEFPYYPFCGRRCKVIDLGRWLGGDYGVPADEQDSPESSPEERELP